MLGLNLGGHAAMVRPVIAPMTEGAARARHGELGAAATWRIRAQAAAAENTGNFFADDIIVAIGPVLLMKGFFDAVGVPVPVTHLAAWGLPTAVWVLVVGWWRCRALDRALAVAARRQGEPGP